MSSEPITEVIRPFQCEVPVPLDPEAVKTIVSRIAMARDLVVMKTGESPKFILIGKLEFHELLNFPYLTRRYDPGVTGDVMMVSDIMDMTILLDPLVERRLTPILEDQFKMATLPVSVFMAEGV